jgi:hypothetical protein
MNGIEDKELILLYEQSKKIVDKYWKDNSKKFFNNKTLLDAYNKYIVKNSQCFCEHLHINMVSNLYENIIEEMARRFYRSRR